MVLLTSLGLIIGPTWGKEGLDSLKWDARTFDSLALSFLSDTSEHFGYPLEFLKNRIGRQPSLAVAWLENHSPETIPGKHQHGRWIYLRGIARHRKNEKVESRPDFLRAQQLSDSTGDWFTLQAIRSQLAHGMIDNGMYDDALATVVVLRKVADSLGSDYFKSLGLLLEGNLHYYLREEPEAAPDFRAAIKICQENGFDLIQGHVEKNLGVLHFEEGRFDSARYYLDNAIAHLSDPNTNLETLSKTYCILGNLFVSRDKDLNRAEALTLKGLEVAQLLETPEARVFALIKLGTNYSLKKEHSEAIFYLHKALTASRQMHNPEGTIYATYSLGYAYQRAGQHDLAFKYAMLSGGQRDSLFRDRMAVNLAEMEARYETEKKIRENERLKQETLLKDAEIDRQKAQKRFQAILLASVMLLLIGISLVFYFRNRLRQRARLQEQEKLRFRAVLEAEEKERFRIARELHDGLGQLLSTAKINVAGLEGQVESEDEVLVSNSMSLIDQAVDEVRDISHNMVPKALLRHGLVTAIQELVDKINAANTLEVNFKAEGIRDEPDRLTQIALYRIVQEVLNNMIKHAEARHIKVDLRENAEQLSLALEDDGRGFDPKTIPQSSGLGWKNIMSRVSMLNGTLSVDSKPNEGTSIRIEIRQAA